jgi:hypothetical protein
VRSGVDYNIRERPAVEKPITDYAVSRGWKTEKIVQMGKRGWPDRISFRMGRVIFWEAKAPNGVLSEQQKLRIAELQEEGIEVHVFYAFDAEVRRVFR